MPSSHILVVRPGALGDTILTIPLLGTLRETWPNARIVFLGTRRYSDLLPGDVAFQDFDAAQWLWLFAGEQEELGTHARCFDRAYVILTNPESVIRNLSSAGTQEIVHASASPRSSTPMVVHLHERLGLAVPPRQPCLGRMDRGEPTDTIWVHPGSGGPLKCIPLRLMASLAAHMRSLTGFRLLVTMSAEDAFLTKVPGWDALVNGQDTVVLQDLPLGELCCKAGSARFFLGNDSGISHLASALGIPAVVFFTRTDPSIWAPWTDPSLLRVMDLRGQDLTSTDPLPLISEIAAFVREAAHR